MKVSEMIEKLEAFKKEQGDLEVVIATGGYYNEYGPFTKADPPIVNDAYGENYCQIGEVYMNY